MALLLKKTYSRHNNDATVVSDKEKENVDPFDELLSSPLKQEVEFQPLSFWGKKIRRLECKEKSKKVDCGLFKASDSDECISPCQRKKKSVARKAKTLQPKSRSQKLSDRGKNYSTSNCSKKKAKAKSLVTPSKNESVASTNVIQENEGWSLDNTLYTKEKALKSFNKRCDTSENGHFNSPNSNPRLHSVRSKLNKSTVPIKLNNFKILEDVSTSEQQLSMSNDTPLTCNSEECSVNGELNFQKCENEMLNSGRDSFRFVCVKRYLNYIDYKTGNNESFLDSTNSNNNSTQLLVKDISTPAEFDDETVVYSNGSSLNTTLNGNETPDKTFFMENLYSALSIKPTNLNNNGTQLSVKDISTSAEFDDGEPLVYSDGSSLSTTLNGSETVGKTFFVEDLYSDLSVKSREIPKPRCQKKSTVSNINMPTELKNGTLMYYDNNLAITILNDDGTIDKTFTNENTNPDLGDKSKDMLMIENTLTKFDGTELEVIIQQLLNGSAVDGVLLETSSTSDDTLSSFMDEETVINVGLKAEKCDSPLTDSGTTKDISHSISSGVSVLTSSISELNIKNNFGSSSPDNEKFEDAHQDLNYEDKHRNSFSIDLRNVTTKRRGLLHERSERKVLGRLSHVAPQREDAEVEFDQSLWIMGRPSVDWNKSISFVNPVFESTRVFDTGVADRKRQTNLFQNESGLEEPFSGFDMTYTLKAGKKWLRSRSVLKQLQNGTIGGGRLESTRITGRKFESFVKEMLEIQNERSGFLSSLADATVSNKTLMGANVQSTQLPSSNASKTVFGCENLPVKFNDSVFCNETVLEKTSLNHTVKVIQQEEKPSAFRSALGLENNNSLLKEDSVLEESSAISARDFILAQCGQEDVLPFEEYFNERTLDNCRKIGEGVYGEVFMCSDTVIKIIPIEGADKVNGEPQKTFAEIISEVVIAAKLSNLRKGKTNRTSGFSELKRCWCVRGKYPKYLLKLWKEYDEQGSGSENDSPVMFKDDQLYIILELANGGKDLESFVFSSSAQSLCLFIQAAFSLAVAEKAFEFEHRDLHWGNMLISETKEKFMTVCLDGVEYKIPTRGVKVCIIDFTLSRINHEGCCIFNDLSVDPGLFASEGDYQFEIYRLMLKEVKNDWSLFRPKTNLFWLHYTVDKMLKMVRYKNKKAKVHIKHLRDLRCLESAVLERKDSADFVLGSPFNDIMNKV